MSTNNSSSSRGKGTPAVLLGIVFIVLKLTHNIDWSWWWVLSPFWIPIAIILIIGLALGLITLLVDKEK